MTAIRKVAGNGSVENPAINAGQIDNPTTGVPVKTVLPCVQANGRWNDHTVNRKQLGVRALMDPICR